MVSVVDVRGVCLYSQSSVGGCPETLAVKLANIGGRRACGQNDIRTVFLPLRPPGAVISACLLRFFVSPWDVRQIRNVFRKDADSGTTVNTFPSFMEGGINFH